MDNQPPGARTPRPTRTPQPHTFRLGRAAFFGLSGVTAGALLLGKKAIPNLQSFVPGAASVNGFTIYTVTNGYPKFDAASYRLRVGGMVDQPVSLSIADILAAPRTTIHDNYQCVTGWTVPGVRWTGIPLAHLLDRARPQAGAHAVKFSCFDGLYTESLTIPQARAGNVLMAYDINGGPLSTAQGAPLRLVVPGMYGYKYAKWVNRIDLIPAPIDGYWEQNGYDRDAYIGRSNGA